MNLNVRCSWLACDHFYFQMVALWIFGTVVGGSFAKASLCNTRAFGCKWNLKILFSLGRLQFIFFLVSSFELLLPSMCKEERKQQQTSRSFTWSETPMENIVGIGLSTLKVIVLFPIGSLRNVFVESYILSLLLILCIYININDVFFFIHVEFASPVYVYAEKLQICSKVLLEVRFNMAFFCILVYTRVYFIGKSLPIQPLLKFLVHFIFYSLNWCWKHSIKNN